MKTLALALLLLTAAPFKESEPGLLAKAKVKLEVARKTALGKVPGGKVKAEEIERENGRLIFSFDISVKGVAGVHEVEVDALTGAVVGDHVETAEDEAREAAGEKSAK